MIISSAPVALCRPSSQCYQTMASATADFKPCRHRISRHSESPVHAEPGRLSNCRPCQARWNSGSKVVPVRVIALRMVSSLRTQATTAHPTGVPGHGRDAYGSSRGDELSVARFLVRAKMPSRHSLIQLSSRLGGGDRPLAAAKTSTDTHALKDRWESNCEAAMRGGTQAIGRTARFFPFADAAARAWLKRYIASDLVCTPV